MVFLPIGLWPLPERVLMSLKLICLVSGEHVTQPPLSVNQSVSQSLSHSGSQRVGQRYLSGSKPAAKQRLKKLISELFRKQVSQSVNQRVIYKTKMYQSVLSLSCAAVASLKMEQPCTEAVALGRE